ncbi:MAG: hypothetical protein IJI22_04635 [Bacilli bacterium]|nr:hypothetical protein [Bacilli bacterium]
MSKKQKWVVSVLVILNLINILILFWPESKKDYSLSIKNFGAVIINKKRYLIKPKIKVGKLDNKKIIWESSNPSVIDVSPCNHTKYCNIIPISVGETKITISYKDEKKKIDVSDSIYIKVLEQEKINFYKTENNLFLYAAKESNDIYSEDPTYKKKITSYTCENVECDMVTGKWTAFIKDGDKYLVAKSVNVYSSTSNEISADMNISDCKNSFCSANCESFKFDEIETVIDNYQGIEALLLAGTNSKYSGVYSAVGIKKIDFDEYQDISTLTPEYKILISSKGMTYLYNYLDGNILKINYSAKTMKGTFLGNDRYYYLSSDTDSRKKCIILDANYNSLFNSKRFDYAYLYDNKLFTYEDAQNGKKPHIYDLTGNEIADYFSPDFELFTYLDNYAVGRKNNKLTVIKLDSSDISDSSLDISGYKFVKLLDRKEKDELGKEINVDFLADNEFIFKFTKDKKEIYVDISIVYGTGLPKIEAKILLEKESD